MNRIIHFEIHADDLERAKKFYTDVFSWNFEKWEGPDFDYWIVYTAPKGSEEPGIDGGLVSRPAKTPKKEQGANAYVCTVEVKSFVETTKKIEKAGGIVAMPKFAIAGMAWQGYFLDTEGNTFGIHEPNKDAK